MAREPIIRAFFDEPTNTVSYLVADPATRQAAVIDPVLDYDPNAGEVDTSSAEAILKAANEAGYTIVWTLETHAHADHLSGSPYIKAKTGAKIGIGEHIKRRAAHLPAGVQRHRPEDRRQRFRPSVQRRRALQDRRDRGGSALYARAHAGGHDLQDRRRGCSSATRCSCPITARRAPISRAVTRTSSTARSGRLLALPPQTRLFMCHDYKAPGRDDYAWETTVAEQRQNNVHVKDGVAEEDFVAMRTARDATLCGPAPHSAVNPGEHPGRQVPARRRQWRALSHDPGEIQEPGRRVRVRARRSGLTGDPR